MERASCVMMNSQHTWMLKMKAHPQEAQTRVECGRCS